MKTNIIYVFVSLLRYFDSKKFWNMHNNNKKAAAAPYRTVCEIIIDQALQRA